MLNPALRGNPPKNSGGLIGPIMGFETNSNPSVHFHGCGYRFDIRPDSIEISEIIDYNSPNGPAWQYFGKHGVMTFNNDWG
jgi:hypothetical protein